MSTEAGGDMAGLRESQLETLRWVAKHEARHGEGVESWWLAEVIDRTRYSAEKRLTRLWYWGYLSRTEEIDGQRFWVYALTDAGRASLEASQEEGK